MSTLPTTPDAGGDDDMQPILFATRGCCCSFLMPCACFRSDSSPSSSSSYGSGWWELMRSPENRELWWAHWWKKIREWPEMVAGPKWKTFIRRFNRTRRISYTKQYSFQYDPLSYALNFDDGGAHKGQEDYACVDFSTRFASIPASMDHGKDRPVFT